MYKKILVPLDGSPRAEAIMPHVEELASCYGAEVILLQIIEPVIAYTSPYDAYPELNMDQAERRTEERRDASTRCTLRIFDHSGREEEIRDAATRDSAFCGLGVVAKLSESIQEGVPIEVIVEPPDDVATHAAGTVAFCRRMDLVHYEIGVHVQAEGPLRIIPENIEEAKALYDWFADALE